MIRLNHEPHPEVLVKHGEAWTAEYMRWSEKRVGREPRRYAHPAIRSALEAETRSKCAYCEARINDVAYTHIEHKLPKSKHPEMVCTWENLTIACPKCNGNKHDYDDPECPLLDAYVDDVEDAVAFGGPLALPRGGARARATITRLELNRKDLLFARGETLWRLGSLLDLVERATSEPELVRSLWLDVDAVTAAEGEFASACRYFVESEMAERSLTRPEANQPATVGAPFSANHEAQDASTT